MAKKARIIVRIDGAMYGKIRSEAQSIGVSISEYTRQKIAQGTVISREDMSQLIKQVHRVGVNINLLSREALRSGYSQAIHKELLLIIEEVKRW